MLGQPCAPRPRPPTLVRARSTNRRTIADRRIASQTEASGGLLLGEQASASASAGGAEGEKGSHKPDGKGRTVSAPLDSLKGASRVGEGAIDSAGGRHSLSSSSGGSSTASPPPPPYPSLASFGSIADASSSTSSDEAPLGIDLGKIESELPTSTPVSEQWIKERSREELDLLLLEADRVIREREKELGIAAAIGKSLLENNIALRKRHESLLQAVPESPTAGVDHVRRSSRQHLPAWDASGEDERKSTLQQQVDCAPLAAAQPPLTVASSSFSEAVATIVPGGHLKEGTFQSESGIYSQPPSPIKPRRVNALALSSPTSYSPPSSAQGMGGSVLRRVPSLTASPQALAVLREQNHELATQLEQLQAETSQADHFGRRQLRRLEKEIGGLRAELEKMETMVESLQEKNGELEVQFTRVVSPGARPTLRDGGWAERRRARQEEDWEMRADDSNGNRFAFPRSQAVAGDGDGADAASDVFTPTPASRQSSGHLHRTSSSNDLSSPPASPRTRSMSFLGPTLSQHGTISSRHSASPPVQRSNAEMEVVAQLLAKIRELEQANTDIRRKRDELDLKLSRAIQEGAALEDVYDALEDEVGRCRLDDDDDDVYDLPLAALSTSFLADGNEPLPGAFPSTATPARPSFASPPSHHDSPFPRKETFFDSPSPSSSSIVGSPTPSAVSTASRAIGNRLMIQERRERRKTSSLPHRPAHITNLHKSNRNSVSFKPALSPALSVGSSSLSTPEHLKFSRTDDSPVTMPPGRSLEDEMQTFAGEGGNTPNRFRLPSRRGRAPKRSSLHLSSNSRDGSPPFRLTANADVSEDDEEAAAPVVPYRRASGGHVVLHTEGYAGKGSDSQVSLRRAPSGLRLHGMPPIVQPGSLSTTPPADCMSFDALDRAVADRPMRWAEDELFGSVSLALHAPPAPRSIWSLFPALYKQRSDPFETDLYREPVDLHDEQTAIARLHFREARIRSAIEAGEDPWTEANLRPPSRRELALIRLSLAANATSGRSDDGGSSSDDDFTLIDGERGGRSRQLLSAPTDGPMLWSERMKPRWVADRVTKSWLRSAMEVVFCIQVVLVGVLFLSEAFRTRKRKGVRAIERPPSRR